MRNIDCGFIDLSPEGMIFSVMFFDDVDAPNDFLNLCFLLLANRVLALCTAKQKCYVLRDLEPNAFFDFATRMLALCTANHVFTCCVILN